MKQLERGILGAALVAAIATGVSCKQRSEQSETKEVGQANFAGKENGVDMYAIQCSIGTTHRGQRYFKVAANVLFTQGGTLCKDPDPAFGGGGTGGGGNGGGDGDLNATSCENIDPVIDQVQLAVNQDAFGTPPAAAKLKFCNNFLRPFAAFVAANRSFLNFINGSNPDSIKFTIEAGAAEIKLEDWGLIQIPWNFKAIKDQFMDKMREQGVTFPPHELCQTVTPTVFNTADRNISYPYDSVQGTTKCDYRDIQSGWYKFEGAAGTKLNSKRVNNRCGTHGIFVLEATDLPQVGDAPKEFPIGAFYNNNTSNGVTKVRVLNCGDFWMYELFPRSVEWCSSRYCGED